MSDYEYAGVHSRNKTMVIVEGDLEKSCVLKTLLMCFPEIPIKYHDIHIFHSDIYDLYCAIEKEYGEKWFEEDLSIDLPFLISQRMEEDIHLDKRNYTNIILIFDYEHHDYWYSDEKIVRMQRHFNNVSDDGLLYINYPMIESLFHFRTIPDGNFCERTVPVTCKPGKEYKNLVNLESTIKKYFLLFDETNKFLTKRISADAELLELYAKDLLASRSLIELGYVVDRISLELGLSPNCSRQLKCALEAKMKDCDFIRKSISYWDDLRTLIIYIVKENIKKAYKIQGLSEKEGYVTTHDKYDVLDWNAILEQQNRLSSDDRDGVIAVLSACITFLGEYKFCWKLLVG